MSKRYFSADEIADIKNARGCNVPWPKLAGHFGVSEDEIKHACGEQVKREPVATAADGEFDLWAVDRLNEVL